MKYYHIIYNSSEKPMDGGVGFGIRTATEGTPEKLLEAIKNIHFFTDDWESYENKPTPAQLKDNPATMETIPMNYAITHITDEEGKPYYLIARRAYVGFDYGFYKNGMPTRPGNYVIDYYAFDTSPERSAYEILYEKAQPTSHHFIPKSVQPTIENEEMIRISLGKQPPLPIEEKGFQAVLEESLTPEVVQLFFTYLQAKEKGQKLLVKASREKTAQLVADFYRMLPPSLAADVRIYVNLRSQGTNDSFDIFFIHEDYPHPIYPGLCSFVELATASLPDTLEAQTFAAQLERQVTSGFERNKSDIDDLLRWLTMPEYKDVKALSKTTNDAFFCYCIQPSHFKYEMLMDKEGHLNQELLKVLCTYTLKNKENAARFDHVVKEAMQAVTPANLIAKIAAYNTLLQTGFQLDHITQAVKRTICTQLLTDDHLLKKAMDTLGYENLERFFVHDLFVSQQAYLDTPTLDPYITQLYLFFYTDEELKKQEEVLWRALKRDMDFTLMCGFMDKVLPQTADKLTFLTKILQKEWKPFHTIWKYFEHYLDDSQPCPNFLGDFSNKKAESEYAPMFYYYLQRRKRTLTTEQLPQLTALLSKNPALKALVEKHFVSEDLYGSIYTAIDAICDQNPQQAQQLIRENVLGFLKVKDSKWHILDAYTQLLLSDAQATTAKSFDTMTLKGVYEKIKEHNNSSLFDALLDSFLQLARKGELTKKAIVETYVQHHPKQSDAEMLSALDSSKNETEIAGILLKELRKKNFKDAFQLMSDLAYPTTELDAFFTLYYKDAYTWHKRKHLLKHFFQKIFAALTPKKKKSATKSSKQTAVSLQSKGSKDKKAQRK